jgi:Putative peptidoglycan binding domain
MAGHDEQRGGDVDDWFDEPQPPRARRSRPNETGSRVDLASTTPVTGADDWLGAANARPSRRSRADVLAELSDRGRLIAVLSVVLVVVLLVGLAVAGVFSSSSKPRPAATPPTATAATTTTPTVKKPAAVAAPAAALKPGDSGAAVKTLQHALTALGYSAGSADGSYGPSTQNAVARFQHAAGLTADGILGPQTLRALRTALKNR